MQDVTPEDVLNFVKDRNVQCIPAECVAFNIPGGETNGVLVGYTMMVKHPHPDYVDHFRRAKVYAAPWKPVWSEKWHVKYIACGKQPKQVSTRRCSVMEVVLSFEDIDKWAIEPDIFVESEEEQEQINFCAPKAHTEFILFVWEHITDRTVLGDVIMPINDTQENRSRSAGQLLSPQSKPKAQKARNPSTRAAKPASKAKKLLPSIDEPAPKRLRRMRPSRIASKPPPPAFDLSSAPQRRFPYYNEDDEEVLPLKEDKKSIVLIDDNKEESRAEKAASEDSAAVGSVGGSDVEDLELEIEMNELKKAQLQAEMDGLQLKRKKAALLKRKRRAGE